MRSAYAGWIDLFGWATSGYNAGTYYHPYHFINTSGYGPSAHLTGAYANCDWGVYNTITYNGNTTSSSWRTLSLKEWNYLLGEAAPAGDANYNRSVNGGVGKHYCYSPAVYSYHNGDSLIAGILIYSDDYSLGSLTNASHKICTITVIPQGCVFLPMTSYRDGASVLTTDGDKSMGLYWTITSSSSDQARCIGMTSSASTGDGRIVADTKSKYYGYPVRLVTDVQ